MWFFYFSLGYLVYFIFSTIYKIIHYASGHVDVDPNTEQCRVHLNPADLSNKKIKKVILKINHNQDISREDHSL